MKPRTVATVTAQILKAYGIDAVFTVPGESFLAFLDALYDEPDIRLIVCRHEGAAAMAAEAYAKMTGQPSVCVVTRGPGLSNAMAGVHVAQQDCTPLILIGGEIPTGFARRNAWQEFDIERTFSPHVKLTLQLNDEHRVSEYLHRAISLARSGMPGPVAIGVPEDVWTRSTDIAGQDAIDCRGGVGVKSAGVETTEELIRLIENSKRPLMICGGGRWTDATRTLIERFADRCGIGLITAWRRQDYIDNTHRNYLGQAGLDMTKDVKDAVAEADLLIGFGSQFEEITTAHYSLLGVLSTDKYLVHILPDPNLLQKVYKVDLPICADPVQLAPMLEKAARGQKFVTSNRRAWLETHHENYLQWSDSQSATSGVELAKSIQWLSDRANEDLLVASDSGNYTLWVHRFFRHRLFKSQLAPTSGSMGYSIPAAISAKLADPARKVISFVGDGGALMTGQELATIKREELAVTIVVINNGYYGSILMHQDMHYPGRTIGTQLANPDFMKLAESFGFKGFKINTADEFMTIWNGESRQDRTILIEFQLASHEITPDRVINMNERPV